MFYAALCEVLSLLLFQAPLLYRRLFNGLKFLLQNGNVAVSLSKQITVRHKMQIVILDSNINVIQG